MRAGGPGGGWIPEQSDQIPAEREQVYDGHHITLQDELSEETDKQSAVIKAEGEFPKEISALLHLGQDNFSE